MSERPPSRQADEQIDLRMLVRIGLVSLGVAIVSVALVYVVLVRRGDIGGGGLGLEPSMRSTPLVERSIESPSHPSPRQAPAVLDTYGWVDRDAGIATIPIERAMEVVAGRGH